MDNGKHMRLACLMVSEDVQYLAGHAEPRTTRLYERRRKKVTRNMVDRISI